LILYQDLPEENLKGKEVAVRQIQKGVEVGIPMAHSVEQGNNGDYRMGKRNQHPNKILSVGTAVQLRCFQKFTGNTGLKVCTGYNHIGYTDSPGEYHGPNSIKHPEVPHQNVAGDHAPGKNHGKGKKKSEKTPAGKILPGKGISAEYRHNNINENTPYGVDDGIPIAQIHTVILENHVVIIKGGVYRQKPDLSGINRCSRRKRRRYNEYHGIQDY
jgi:hypothetical protein